MLDKSDLKAIQAIVDGSLKPIKTDVSSLKQDVSGLKQDMRAVKTKLDDLYDFSVDAFGNILDWTQEIHTTLVQKKLPERVKRIEKHLGLSAPLS